MEYSDDNLGSALMLGQSNSFDVPVVKIIPVGTEATTSAFIATDMLGATFWRLTLCRMM